jgi:hypothetical protein
MSNIEHPAQGASFQHSLDGFSVLDPSSLSGVAWGGASPNAGFDFATVDPGIERLDSSMTDQVSKLRAHAAGAWRRLQQIQSRH